MRLSMLSMCALGTVLTSHQEPERAYLSLARTAVPLDAALALPAADQSSAAERAERAVARWRTLDASRTSLDARAATLGAGIEPAFALLRDEIGLQSYSGVLRAAQGTWAERAGNGLDRALLLADLLRRQGMVVRFARGRLESARADALVERLFAVSSTGHEAAPAERRAEHLLARVRARASRDLGALRSALNDRGPTPALPSRDELARELRDHFWVQVQRDGEWLDLDPAFPDLQPGQRAAAAEETWDTLPEELQQTVTVRVAVEEIAGGALELRTVLEVTRPAWRLLDEHVLLLHVPRQALGDAIGSALGGTAGGRVAPLLQLGDVLVAGDAFATEAAGGGALASVLDEAGALTSSSSLAAEWLEIELRFPDGRSELHRRALLDRAPRALRSGGEITAEQLGPMPPFWRDVHALAFAAGRGDLAAYAEAAAWLCAGLETDDEDAGDEPAELGIDALWPFALQLHGWMLCSSHRVVPALGDRPDVRLYADAPRVWIESLVHDAASPETPGLVLDLRRDRLRGIADDPAKAGEVALRKLWFALLEGALEHELLASVCAAAGGDPRAVETTSAALGTGGARILRDAADGPPVARALLAEALERGSTAVLPAGAAGAVAFWEIEPDGDARAVFGDDWNGARVIGRVPGGAFPNSSYAGGGRVAPSQRGGLNTGGNTGGTGGRPPKAWNPNRPGGGGPRGPRGGGGRGGGSEYGTLLMTISIPSAYGWFVVGLAVEVTGGAVAAILIDEGVL